MGMKRMILLSVVAMMAAMMAGCGKKESAASNNTKAATERGTNDGTSLYSDEAMAAYRELIDEYLLFDDSTLEEMMQLGAEVLKEEEIKEIGPSSKKFALEAKELHAKCVALLEKRDMRALHDVMYENFETFAASPNANLEIEDVLIHGILNATENEYPNDSIRYFTEAEKMLDWRCLHFWTVEMMSSQGDPDISDDHVACMLFLMAARNALGKYDESLEGGEHLLEHIKRFAPDHDGREALESVIEKTRELKGKGRKNEKMPH